MESGLFQHFQQTWSHQSLPAYNGFDQANSHLSQTGLFPTPTMSPQKTPCDICELYVHLATFGSCSVFTRSCSQSHTKVYSNSCTLERDSANGLIAGSPRRSLSHSMAWWCKSIRSDSQHGLISASCLLATIDHHSKCFKSNLYKQGSNICSHLAG